MPPPPRPVRTRNDQSLRPRVFGSHPEQFHSTNRSSESNRTQADFEEKEDSRGTKDHVPETEQPFMTDEEIATMSARSDAAMAEIYRMCRPFLDPCANIQEPPPMELSTELIDDLEVGFLFPTHAGGPTRARRNNETKPNPTRTMQPRNVAQMAPKRQGTKRKEYPEDKENFQNVQFDIEREERRPVKRVKSVQNANPQRIDTELNKDAGKKSHQKQSPDSQLREYLSGYGYGRTLGRPAPQGSRAPRHAMVEDITPYNGGVLYGKQFGEMMGRYPNQVSKPYQPQRYPSTLSRTTFPDPQPPREPVASPYIPTSTGRQGVLDHYSFVIDPGVSSVTSPHGDVQNSQAMEPHSYKRSSAPNKQDVYQQRQAMAQSSPRADRGHHREPRAHNSNDLRYHPYAKSRRDITQSKETPQIQQLGGESSAQPVGTAAAQVDQSSVPDVAPATLEHVSPLSRVPDFQWNPEWDSFLEEL